MTGTQVALSPETIQVGGRDVFAVKDGEEVRVIFNYCCESLGLDAHAQAKKMENRTFMNYRDIAIVTRDGKTRQMRTISLDALPLWLANINENRVSAHHREAIVSWQLESKRVLAEHFFGPQQVPGQPLSPVFEPGLYLPEEAQYISSFYRNLRQSGFSEFGQRKLFDYIAMHGLITRRWVGSGDWMATTLAEELGFAKTVWSDSPHPKPQVYITQAGITFIRNKLAEQQLLELTDFQEMSMIEA